MVAPADPDWATPVEDGLWIATGDLVARVDGVHRATASAHGRRDIAVDREATARLIPAGFRDLAGQTGGQVDLELVPANA
jgi:hypothetical protein